MPVVARLRTNASPSPDAPEEAVHSIKLWMPSVVASLGMVCTTTLYDIEWKLRSAQAHDALQELRQHLRLKRHLTGFKKDWIRGQHAHTRSRAVIGTVQLKIDAAATTYRTAWAALESLAVKLLKISWQVEFPKLNNDDVRGMTEGQAGGEAETEGRRLVSVSWIWKQQHGAGEEELSEGKVQLSHLLWRVLIDDSDACRMVQSTCTRKPVGQGSRTPAGRDATRSCLF